MPEQAPDERLIAAHDLAKQALLEITPESTIGPVVGHVVEGEHVLSLLFECTLLGYPGWNWTVSLARVDGDAEPVVLEAELLPGDHALLAPDWVPWSERLAEYQAAQEAARAAGGSEASDDGSAEGSAEAGASEAFDDDLDDDDDDEDDLDLDRDDDIDGIDIDLHGEADAEAEADAEVEAEADGDADVDVEADDIAGAEAAALDDGSGFDDDVSGDVRA